MTPRCGRWGALAPLASGVSLTSEVGTVVSVTWDASLLGTADGSAVELRVVGTASVDRSAEVGAVEWDARVPGTGAELYFLRARYYDPAQLIERWRAGGRFIGRDPIEFAQRYAYARNNPVAFTDPSGLEYEGEGFGWDYLTENGRGPSREYLEYKNRQRGQTAIGWVWEEKLSDEVSDPWILAGTLQAGAIAACRTTKNGYACLAAPFIWGGAGVAKLFINEADVESGKVTVCEAKVRELAALLPLPGIDKWITQQLADAVYCRETLRSDE